MLRSAVCLLGCLLPLLCIPPSVGTRADEIGAGAGADALLLRDALIREGMRHNAEGRFAAALTLWKRMTELDPNDPAPHVYATDTLYWLMVFDGDRDDYDAAILRETGLAVAKARRSGGTPSGDAQRDFLLGQALMHQGRLHGVRGRIYRAGRLGERAREHLERALELDPSLVDARFPLGLYYYYASLVPSLFQWFNFLWFIPVGDGDTGLGFLEDVRRHGDLHQYAGAFFLANILGYHDARLDRPQALSILRELHQKYPSNSLFHFELIELLMMQKRYGEVVRESRELEAHEGTEPHDRGRAAMARVWRARAELELGQPERAWKTLEFFGSTGPERPSWGAVWVSVVRGQVLDVRSERTEALRHYYAVIALDLPADESRATQLARAGVVSPYETGAP